MTLQSNPYVRHHEDQPEVPIQMVVSFGLRPDTVTRLLPAFACLRTYRSGVPRVARSPQRVMASADQSVAAVLHALGRLVLCVLSAICRLRSTDIYLIGRKAVLLVSANVPTSASPGGRGINQLAFACRSIRAHQLPPDEGCLRLQVADQLVVTPL
jgi:hypothetical protein